MLISILAMAASVASTTIVHAVDPAPAAPPSITAPIADRFADREEARIPFTSSIRGFRVEREGNDDVLYVEANARAWFRAELSCFGFGDARHAFSMAADDRGFGLDRLSRVTFFGFGHHDRTNCHITSLIKLTPEEAIDLKLERAPKRK